MKTMYNLSFAYLIWKTDFSEYAKEINLFTKIKYI